MKKIKFFTALLVMALLASCSKETDKVQPVASTEAGMEEAGAITPSGTDIGDNGGRKYLNPAMPRRGSIIKSDGIHQLYYALDGHIQLRRYDIDSRNYIESNITPEGLDLTNTRCLLEPMCMKIVRGPNNTVVWRSNSVPANIRPLPTTTPSRWYHVGRNCLRIRVLINNGTALNPDVNTMFTSVEIWSWCRPHGGNDAP